MEKRLRPKKYVVPMFCLFFVIVLITGIFLISSTMSSNSNEVEESPTYVSEIVNEGEAKPVINESTNKMAKPYIGEKVRVGKSFYDYKGDAKAQENSITYYDGRYIQNSGIDYVEDQTFDVIAVLDGTVTDVKEDDVLGKIIEIKHDKDYVTSYQSLSEVSVKKNDTIKQGQIIGKSGTNKLDKDMGNHLHFELYTKGQVVDPSLYIDKEIKSE